MEWSIQPHSKQSATTQKPFAVGDKVISILWRTAEGLVERLDVHVADANTVEVPGVQLGRWEHVIKQAQGVQQAMQAQEYWSCMEGLFISLYDAEPSNEGEVIKQLLALMLERKRMLKRVGGNKDKVNYQHTKTQTQYTVHFQTLDPQLIVAMQAQLESVLPKAVRG